LQLDGFLSLKGAIFFDLIHEQVMAAAGARNKWKLEKVYLLLITIIRALNDSFRYG
jgi:hypothetical protein